MSAVEIDRNGLEVLDRETCLSLLATATLGRVGFSSEALPVVLPVTFALTDDAVVFRTVAGTKLDAALGGSVVAFESDDVDPLEHCGWSVVVTGVAEPIADPASLPVEAHRAPRWIRTGRAADDNWIRIPTDIVSGRRLR